MEIFMLSINKMIVALTKIYFKTVLTPKSTNLPNTYADHVRSRRFVKMGKEQQTDFTISQTSDKTVGGSCSGSPTSTNLDALNPRGINKSSSVD